MRRHFRSLSGLGRAETALVCAASVAVLVLASCVPDPHGDPSNTNDNVGGRVPGVEIAVPNEGARHVSAGTQVQYLTNPPASGSHWSSVDPPAPVAPGFYRDHLEEEQWVHNLEHGYVVILYDCAGPCDEGLLADLEAFADEAVPSAKYGYVKLVIAPYDGRVFPLVAIAWDVQMYLEAFDDQALTAFLVKYQDEGPEDAP